LTNLLLPFPPQLLTFEQLDFIIITGPSTITIFSIMASPTSSKVSPKPLEIIILGGGIAGLTLALALTKFAPEEEIPRIRIFEIRPEPVCELQELRAGDVS
jgi:hypothetical protein